MGRVERSERIVTVLFRIPGKHEDGLEVIREDGKKMEEEEKEREGGATYVAIASQPGEDQMKNGVDHGLGVDHPQARPGG